MAGFGFSASSDILTIISRSLGPACGFDRTVEVRCVCAQLNIAACLASSSLASVVASGLLPVHDAPPPESPRLRVTAMHGICIEHQCC